MNKKKLTASGINAHILTISGSGHLDPDDHHFLNTIGRLAIERGFMLMHGNSNVGRMAAKSAIEHLDNSKIACKDRVFSVLFSGAKHDPTGKPIALEMDDNNKHLWIGSVSDVLIAIGGGKGTQIEIEQALKSKKLVLPIPGKGTAGSFSAKALVTAGLLDDSMSGDEKDFAEGYLEEFRLVKILKDRFNDPKIFAQQLMDRIVWSENRYLLENRYYRSDDDWNDYDDFGNTYNMK